MITQASSLATVARAARAFCIALLASLALTLPASADDTQWIGSIDFISGQRGAMPGPDAAWQAHPLPLRWTSSGGTRQGLWLRFGFEVASAPAEGWSLLLDRLPSGGAIFLNGKMVADLPTVQRMVLLPYLDPSATPEGLPGGMPWNDLLAKDAALGDALLQVHFSLNMLFAVLVTGHAGAALKHHFIDRDDILARMLPRRTQEKKS